MAIGFSQWAENFQSKLISISSFLPFYLDFQRAFGTRASMKKFLLCTKEQA
jgi:hypothetical protein